MIHQTPINTADLLQRAHALEALTLAELCAQYQQVLPQDMRRAKGWIGQLLETALGTTSGNKPQPDFAHLGIELKTIPMSEEGRVLESTFVCTAQLTDTHLQTWKTSVVYQKLKKLLWIPIITANKSMPLAQRKIGCAYLWELSPEQEALLQADWEELMDMIALGELALITARHGTYLQLRPKGANARVLCKAIGEHGESILTLPRGFYLRASFTGEILRSSEALHF